jgi:predicted small secreted protein
MKIKQINISVIVLLLAFVFTACATGPQTSRDVGMSLDQAIVEAITMSDSSYSEGTKAVLIYFTSDYDKLNAYMNDKLNSRITSVKNLKFMDRGEVDRKLKESNITIASGVSYASLDGVRQALGAQAMMYGGVYKEKGKYKMYLYSDITAADAGTSRVVTGNYTVATGRGHKTCTYMTDIRVDPRLYLLMDIIQK